MTKSGKTFAILGILWKVFLVVIAMHLICIFIQFTIAGSVSRKNPLTLIKNQVPGYTTALGTQSSAATIPVNLQCAEADGVSLPVRPAGEQSDGTGTGRRVYGRILRPLGSGGHQPVRDPWLVSGKECRHLWGGAAHDPRGVCRGAVPVFRLAGSGRFLSDFFRCSSGRMVRAGSPGLL